MAKRGTLDVPVIGVAKAGWTLDQLRARAQDSVEKHGGAGPCGVRQAVRTASLRRRGLQGSGDLRGAATRARRRQAPRALPRDPPSAVRTRRRTTGAIGVRDRGTRRRRETIRGGSRLGARPESDPARHVRGGATSSGSTTTSESGPFTTCCSLASRIRFWRRSGIGPMSRACRSRWRRISASRDEALSTTRRAPSATSSRTTCSSC